MHRFILALLTLTLLTGCDHAPHGELPMLPITMRIKIGEPGQQFLQRNHLDSRAM